MMINHIDVILKEIIRQSSDTIELVNNLKGVVTSYEHEGFQDLPRDLFALKQYLKEESEYAEKKVRYIKRVITNLEAIMEVKK